MNAPILQPKKNLPRSSPRTGILPAWYSLLSMDGTFSTPLRIWKRLRNSFVSMNFCCFARSQAFTDTVTVLTRLWIFALQRSLFGHPAHWSQLNETWHWRDFLPVYPQGFGSYPAGHFSTVLPEMPELFCKKMIRKTSVQAKDLAYQKKQHMPASLRGKYNQSYLEL